MWKLTFIAPLGTLELKLYLSKVIWLFLVIIIICYIAVDILDLYGPAIIFNDKSYIKVKILLNIDLFYLLRYLY